MAPQAIQSRTSGSGIKVTFPLIYFRKKYLKAKPFRVKTIKNSYFIRRYEYRECGLSDITLHWMIDRACEHGLRIKASAVNNLKKDPYGMLHNSYDGIWQAFGERLRSIDNFETVHASTKERMDKITEYRPINLPMNPSYET